MVSVLNIVLILFILIKLKRYLFMIKKQNLFSLILIIIMLLITSTTLYSQDESKEVKWLKTYEEAIEKAKELDRNIYVIATAPSWSDPCKKMFKETFTDTKIINTLNNKYIPLMVEDINPDISLFEVENVPTSFIVGNDGKTITSKEDFMSVDDLSKFLEKYANYDAQTSISWYYSYKLGLQKAQEENKNMLILITAPSWCGPCQWMEENTLKDAEVIQVLNENFISIKVLDEVDGKENPDLELFDFPGYPTMLIYDRNGDMLDGIVGSVEKDYMLEIISDYKSIKTASNDDDSIDISLDDDDTSYTETVNTELTEEVETETNIGDGINWYFKYNNALSSASDSGKYLFVLLTAPSWNGASQWMDENTFKDENITNILNNDFVPVRITDKINNKPNEELFMFDPEGYPTIYIMDEYGNRVDRFTGAAYPYDLLMMLSEYTTISDETLSIYETEGKDITVLEIRDLENDSTEANAPAREVDWYMSYDTALEASSDNKKSMFVLITAPSWCGPCQWMEDNTLIEPDIVEMLEENFIPLKVLDEVNGQVNPDLQHFEYYGYPTIKIFDPYGNLLDEVVGSTSSDTLYDTLSKNIYKTEEDLIITDDEETPVETTDTETDKKIDWYYYYDEGIENAKTSDKNMFVLITAPTWCGPCQWLEENTLTDTSVIDIINENYIPVFVPDIVDGFTNEDLYRFEFEGYPTMKVLNADGELIEEIVGAVYPEELLIMLNKHKSTNDNIEGIKSIPEFSDEKSMLDYVVKLYKEGSYKECKDSALYYFNDKTLDMKYRESFIFIAFVSCFYTKDLTSAIRLSDEYIRKFPTGKEIETVKYLRILTLYYTDDKDLAKSEADDFKSKYPDSKFIKKLDKIF